MSVNGPPPPSGGPEVPEDFHLLCVMHNLGATAAEKALSLAEISERVRMEPSAMRLHLSRLVGSGYILSTRVEETERFHLTANGILKVLTMYS